MTAQAIISEINAYMKQHGGLHSDWYVGIAANAELRVFTDHKVEKATGAWIYRRADSSTIARNVERIYRNAGCDGAAGGGDAAAVFVYSYRKTPQTDP